MIPTWLAWLLGSILILGLVGAGFGLRATLRQKEE